MRIEIRLSDEDRERLGVSSEWITYDHERVGIRLLAEVQKVLGLTLPEFDRGIAEGNALAVWGLVWIALRTTGVDVGLEGFDFQANTTRIRRVADEEVEPGKDDPSTPSTGTPTPKKSSTTRTSTRSSATTRSRSRT